tara:strand:+ start:163 stop:1023 length:861 start_codon:yes stop_codon:yes gene_type:complete
MKVLVTGGNGQLGSELKKTSIKDNNFKWVFTDRKSFDLTLHKNINFYLDNIKPDIIINCAAYTSVNYAENNFETANAINHIAVDLIAKWANKNNCKLIHISTDYVYDGNSKIPYFESDKTNPLNSYGRSKLLGDIACQKNNNSFIIIRTSWLYSSFGDNFVTNMIKLMYGNAEIKVINDQFGSPTYAGDLAFVILHLIRKKKWISGIYNYSNKGNISWYDFANEIKSIYGFSTIINPISSESYNQNVIRPKFSILDNSKIMDTFDIKQVDYLSSLKKCIKILKNES